jgi:hypothetical protein
MIVFIDRQHAGKPKKINDRGASRDLNGDGEITAEELEAIWTARLAVELEIKLYDKGIKVMPLSDGNYSARHARVNEYAELHPGPWVYLALHLNSGGGSYGSYFYDSRSTKGQQLATMMAKKLKEGVEHIDTAKAIPAKADDWTQNAFYTIRNVGRPVAICCEPFFMDTHQRLLSIPGMASIATTMVNALLDWRKIHE